MRNKNKPDMIYNTNRISDLKDMITISEKKYGDKAAFHIKDKKGEFFDITYSKFKEDIDAFGTYLLNKGLKDRFIAVIGENRYEWCLTYMSVVCGVGVIVPIDKELKRDEIKNLLTRSGASVLVTSDKYLSLSNELKTEISTLESVICMDEVKDHDNEDIISALKEGKSLLASNNEYITTKINRDTLSILLYTSGTTDLAKGVMLSHRNICSNIMSVSGTVKLYSTDKIVSVLPIHHTYECTCGFLLMIYSGASIAFNEGLKYIAKNMQEVKPTLGLFVPLILESLYKKVVETANKKISTKLMFKTLVPFSYFIRTKLGINLGKIVFSKVHKNLGGNLRLIISGAAGIDPDISKGLRSIGFTVLQGYGLTECSPIATANRENNFVDSSIGLPIPYVDVELVDVDENGIGEIVIRGENVMLGYYKNREATEAVLIDEWLYTGDLGYKDENGFFYISGRKKNVIVTKNGKNIFPEEVESYISKSKYIIESMVWGNYETNLQENYVHATIVPDMQTIEEKLLLKTPSDIDVEKLIAEEIKEINLSLPLYKKIKSFTIQYEELEKTTTKKIKRFSGKK